MASLEAAAEIFPMRLATSLKAVPKEYKPGEVLVLALAQDAVWTPARMQEELTRKLGIRVVCVHETSEVMKDLIERCYYGGGNKAPLGRESQSVPTSSGSGRMDSPTVIRAEFSKLDYSESSKDAIKKIHRSDAYRNDVLPLLLIDGSLHVGMVKADDYVLIEDLERKTQCKIVAVQMSHIDIMDRLKQIYPAGESASQTQPKPNEAVLQEIWRAALLNHASDVHFDATQEGGSVYFSIDGELEPFRTVTKQQQDMLTSAIMIAAEMRPEDKGRPQSGRTSVRVDGKSHDIRLQSLPVQDGVSVVARMMPSNDSITTLEERGMLPEFVAQFRTVIRQPYGMVLVCGPMGSGKTNTLYSAILDIKNPKMSFRSAENPVEMKLDWVQQTTIKDNDQFNFKDMIKAFVRANPKVILIGELRDQETAIEGLTASMLGHLVFATTHGNNSALVIQRLLNLGATRDDIAAALSAIISQRLIRKLCLHCRKPAELPVELRQFAGIFRQRFGKDPVYYEASRCELCRNSGYSGRLGIFELLEVDDTVSQAILDKKHASVILKSDPNYKPMIIDGIWKVFLGLTDVAQLQKVVRWNLSGAMSYLQEPTSLRVVNE